MSEHIISKDYIDIAVRIRKEYFTNLALIETKTDVMIKCKKELEELNTEIDAIQNNDPKVDKIVIEKMSKLEYTLNKLQSEIFPIHKKIEDLGNEADRLFDGLKEKYPGITTEEIQEQITPHLD